MLAGISTGPQHTDRDGQAWAVADRDGRTVTDRDREIQGRIGRDRIGQGGTDSNGQEGTGMNWDKLDREGHAASDRDGLGRTRTGGCRANTRSAVLSRTVATGHGVPISAPVPRRRHSTGVA